MGRLTSITITFLAQAGKEPSPGDRFSLRSMRVWAIEHVKELDKHLINNDEVKSYFKNAFWKRVIEYRQVYQDFLEIFAQVRLFENTDSHYAQAAMNWVKMRHKFNSALLDKARLIESDIQKNLGENHELLQGQKFIF